MLCVACRAAPPPPPECPEPPRIDPALVATETPTPPADDPPASTPASELALNCQAPLQATAEITRLLTAAAGHSTQSSACVDGPGRRVAIDEILVCPAASTDAARRFSATYRVTEFEEGGRQVCGPDCPPRTPSSARHRIELSFAPQGDRFVLDVPAQVPGGPPDATPLREDHDGKCYGPAPRFVALPIALR